MGRSVARCREPFNVIPYYTAWVNTIIFYTLENGEKEERLTAPGNRTPHYVYVSNKL